MTQLETSMYYTYILRSKKDGKWYTGATNNLRKRLMEHNNDMEKSTKNRGPFEIIYYEACVVKGDAFAREKYLKSGLGKRFVKNRIKHFLSLTGQVSKVYPVGSRSPEATVSFNGGFAALVTALILSLILIIITVTLTRSGFFARSAILEAEFKETSSALAEACVDVALLRLARDFSYVGNETVTVNENECTIRIISGNTIETTAEFRESITNLSVVFNPTDLSVISWDEVVSF